MDNTSSAHHPFHGARNFLGNYYKPGGSITDWSAELGVPVSRLEAAGTRELAALIVIVRNGMRAGEYLRLVAGDILHHDMVFVRGEKGSADYVIYLPGVTSQFEDELLRSPGRLVAGTTYARLYAACVRVGYAQVIAGRYTLARTHAGRYSRAKEVNGLGGRAVSDCLHHRSERSAKFYTGARR